MLQVKDGRIHHICSTKDDLKFDSQSGGQTTVNAEKDTTSFLTQLTALRQVSARFTNQDLTPERTVGRQAQTLKMISMLPYFQLLVAVCLLSSQELHLGS